MIKIKKFLVFGFIISIVVVTIMIEQSSNQCKPIRANTNGSGREIRESTIDYKHLWDSATSYIPSKGIQILDGMVIISSPDCQEIVAINPITGENIWKFSLNFPRQFTIDAVRKNLYISDRGRLVAISAEGEELWANDSQRNLHGGIIPYMLADGELVVFSASQDFLFVDPETGSFENKIVLPEFLDALNLINDNYFWRVSNGQLEARYIETGDISWISEYTGLVNCCLEQVEVTSNFILLHFASNLVILNQEDGSLFWKFDDEDIVSNLSITEDRVTFLDINAKLYTFEIESGKLLGAIQFSPPSAEAMDIVDNKSKIGSSILVTEGKGTIIYFGDTLMIEAYELMLD